MPGWTDDYSDVLRAILRVESGLRPAAINRNTNGTLDVGIGQINSIHFRRLSEFGIAPGHLLDACIGTYVAAWHLGQLIERHGWSWETIGRYHSITPQHNRRYQWLVYNELRRVGAPGVAAASTGRPPPVAMAADGIQGPASAAQRWHVSSAPCVVMVTSLSASG